MLYESRLSCIPNFGLRIRNILSGSPLLDTRVRPWLLLNLTPWNFQDISFIDPFKNFDKANTTANIYHSLFKSHRSHYHKYIDIYSDGSKTNNSVGCGHCLQKYYLELPPTHILFCILCRIPCCRTCSEAHFFILP